MCHLSYYAPGIPVNVDDLLRAHEVNTDGCGFAICADGAFLVAERSMEPLAEQFAAWRAKCPGDPAVYHARLSTGSAAVPANLHPFPAGDDSQTLIFHNGSLPVGDWAKDMCDTKAFADYVFPAAFAGLDDEAEFGLMEQWATKANKLAILTVNPRYAGHAYIVNRDQWLVSPEGILYSNADHLGRKAGWDEEVTPDGDLKRWRVLQPGQCWACGVFHSGAEHPAPPLKLPGHPAFRNETKRRAQVAAAKG